MHYGVEENSTERRRTVDVWISELPNILPRDLKCGNVAKESGKGKMLGSLLDKVVEKLVYHGSAKTQDLRDQELWIRLSFPFRQNTTLHCKERQTKLFDNWIMHHMKL